MNILSGLTKLVLSIALSCATLPGLALSDDGPAPGVGVGDTRDNAARAQALLQRSVAHYKETKDAGLKDFDNHGDFIDRELYVYVVSDAGRFLASGGSSSGFIGRQVTNQKDALGKPFFRELLRNARRTSSGTVDYHWLNPVDNKVEPKKAYFRKVDHRILVVGYYAP